MYNFISDAEKKISIEFETKGYIIKKIPKKFFNEIEKEFVNFIKKKLKIKKINTLWKIKQSLESN